MDKDTLGYISVLFITTQVKEAMVPGIKQRSANGKQSPLNSVQSLQP